MYFSSKAQGASKLKWVSAIGSIFLIASLLLVGCGQQTEETAEKKSRMVSMVLADLQGIEHDLVDYRGQWVIVNYWATWCPPCLDEIPELEIFHHRHKDKDAVVWGINREAISLTMLKKFVAQQHISYPVFQVSPDSVSVLGSNRGIPTTYLISPKGEVVARHVGLVTVKKLEEFMQRYAGKGL